MDQNHKYKYGTHKQPAFTVLPDEPFAFIEVWSFASRRTSGFLTEDQLYQIARDALDAAEKIRKQKNLKAA
jgi:hypothetical protein